MNEPKWLKYFVVEYIHRLQLSEHGGPDGVRDELLLQSALDRPRNKFTYNANCSLYELASAYAFGIARNHPFVDGNKRSAFVCGAVFLEINGLIVNAAEADTVVIMESLAAGTIDETQLAEWFRLNSVPH